MVTENCPCIVEDISKGSPFFEMHSDYWKIVSRYFNGDVNGQRTDMYWKEVVDAAEEFAHKYPGKYALSLMLTFLDELERRDKLERSMAAQTKTVSINRVPA